MISVAIPTAGRPDHLRRSLRSVLDQDAPIEEVIVVDQSTDRATERVVAELDAEIVRYVCDPTPGASRARNLAAAEAATDYVVFLDDDGEVAPDWARQIRAAIARHDRPDALYGAIHAPEGIVDRADLAVSTFQVESSRTWDRLVHPSRLGYSALLVVKRSAFLELGGFDPALGPGTPLFGAEDMDLNYRILRAQLHAVTTPDIWMIHHQWRDPADIPRLFYRYNLGHSAFCVKHLLGGDLYPLRMIAIQALGDAKMLASGIRRRSMLRVRASFRRAAGTWHGLLLGWRTFRR